jgi:putative DNA primase/helicase
MTGTSDAFAQIREHMQTAGIEAPPDHIAADGKVHRFVSVHGRRSASGWYVVHDDCAGPVWFFGDWRLGISERGEGDPGRTLKPREAAARKARLKALQAKIRWEGQRFQAGAAIEAKERWERCAPAPSDHAYLRRKGINADGARFDFSMDALLIPMRDVDGKIWSIQEIWPDGRKYNQEGARRKGCFHQIGDLGDIFIIAEGFSTAATLHQATGCGVVSAGEAGNLKDVAVSLRRKHPAATIIIAGDDDWLTNVKGKPKNIGKLSAQKAAAAVDGVLTLPWFDPGGRPRWATDINDMAKLYGLDEVATRIRLDRIADAERAEQTGQTGAPSPAFSDDAVALRFAEAHAGDLRFVESWLRWHEWREIRWMHDRKLKTMTLVRRTCRAAAEEIKEEAKEVKG